jgi:hypothetical protein
MKHLIADAVLEEADGIRSRFVAARPFKHACIEDFLDPHWAETLLRDFPAFDPAKAVDEFGKVGRKAVRTDLREISDAYRQFYDYISSPEFLEAMSAMTGIPELRFDQQMYGGGTHENLEGQALDAHVDFNYDQRRQLHRRINLLVYLNKEWDMAWGGAIQLHSDPRDWEHDRVETFNCNFNRCVIFETNEHSWHGFKRIALPAGRHGLTRKCISIYLYTRERPAEEIVPVHGTFYVQQALPEQLVPGRMLVEADIQELKRLLDERDEWIRFYQRMRQTMHGENHGLRDYVRSLSLHGWADGLVIGSPLRVLRGQAARAVSLGLRAMRPFTRPAALAEEPPEPGLPAALTLGHILTADEVRALKLLLRARDDRIHRYQRQELELRSVSDVLHARIDSLLGSIRLPLGSGLRQSPGSLQGAYAGGWVASRLETTLQAPAGTRTLEIAGKIPAAYPPSMRIDARIDGQPAGEIQPVPGARFLLRAGIGKPLAAPFKLELLTIAPAPLPVPAGDQRDLAFVLKGIRART